MQVCNQKRKTYSSIPFPWRQSGRRCFVGFTMQFRNLPVQMLRLLHHCDKGTLVLNINCITWLSLGKSHLGWGGHNSYTVMSHTKPILSKQNIEEKKLKPAGLTAVLCFKALSWKCYILFFCLIQFSHLTIVHGNCEYAVTSLVKASMVNMTILKSY